ncbi:hypothetical protein ASG88_21850 [Nocardioides sp. Soil777]|uniref:hypothetical protein n=1 Tax=Nocardioides sp. Soil777 TaxID=1736409 RepID=UPI000703383D|nr:hypothetical protein [Nocardioides sp. Soil777]KRF04087.1 hypothetical protein ASG88_21850 [Nocardioides sp. Soil777]
MMLLKLPVAAMPESGDPFHPHVRLPVSGALSRQDLHQVAGHLRDEGCVHVTLTIPHRGLLAFMRRRSASGADTDVRDRLADLAWVLGPDASRVMVRFQNRPGALRGWWEAWAWRRGVGGPGRPSQPERPLDELVAQPDPHPDATSPEKTRRCEGRPHVLAAAAEPLEWEVIDELHRWVSVGCEVHLALTVPPRSPVSREPELHLLWERRMALDVADREGEVAQLWPGTPLVRIDVVRTNFTAGRSRWTRQLVRPKR